MTESSSRVEDPVGTWIVTSWKAFNAKFQDKESSDTQDCQATLYYCLKGTNNGYHTKRGATGKQHGHAEMDALDQFLTEVGVKSFDDYDVLIECSAKPCCVHCSIVLGALGIRAANGSTQKCKTIMGKSTQYSASLKVKELLTAKGVLKYFESLCNYDTKMLRNYL